MKKVITILVLLVSYFLCSVSFAGNVFNSRHNAGIIEKPGPGTHKAAPNLHILSIKINKQQLVVGKPFEIIVSVQNSSGRHIVIPKGVGRITSEDKYGPSTHHGVPGIAGKVYVPGTASGPTDLILRIGNEPPITFHVPSLAPNKTVTFRKSYTATKPGLLTIICTVDPNNRVKEGNENDNTFKKSVRVAGLPDFRIVELYLTPYSVRVGDNLTIHAVIQNFGESGGATFMRFDIHGDIPGAQDMIMHPEVNVPFLAPGQKTEVSYSFTPLQAGTYTFGGGVNIPVRTPEANEHNNAVPGAITIQVKPAGAGHHFH